MVREKIVKCRECGKEFNIYTRPPYKRVECSDECREKWLNRQGTPIEYKEEVKRETGEYKPIQKIDNNKTVIPVVLKIKLYKYVLIAMSFLLGFHLYSTVQIESGFLLSLIENPEYAEEIIAYYEIQRKLINMALVLTILFCVVLVVVAGVLYKIELSICKKIKSKRR